jgi:hypothetical protein
MLRAAPLFFTKKNHPKYGIGQIAVFLNESNQAQDLVLITNRFSTRIINMIDGNSLKKEWYYDARHIDIERTTNPDIPFAPKMTGGITTIPESYLRPLEALVQYRR